MGDEPGLAKPGSKQFYIFMGASAGLVLFAGMMSGLTLGLMGISNLDLELMERTGGAVAAKRAARIRPLTKRPHLLLVTLLLWNAAAMEALPLLLGRIVPEILAVAISVTGVLFFGEILPQAVCSRYGAAVGAASAPIVHGLIYLSAIIAWPLSKLLDAALGDGHSAMFRRSELKAIVDIHDKGAEPKFSKSKSGRVSMPKSSSSGTLSQDEAQLMRGAMLVADATVSMAMTPLKDTFALSTDAPLDRETLLSIVDRGHSRVPLHAPGNDSSLRSVLLVKSVLHDLLLRDEGEERTVEAAAAKYARVMPQLDQTTPLYDAIDEFQTGGSHMAAVIGADGLAIGVITLEDVLEELLQEEIIDETDQYADITKRAHPLSRSKSSGRGIVSDKWTKVLNGVSQARSPTTESMNAARSPTTEATRLLDDSF